MLSHIMRISVVCLYCLTRVQTFTLTIMSTLSSTPIRGRSLVQRVRASRHPSSLKRAHVAYPLRDRFQFLRPGVTLTLHGAVKWFYSGSYSAFHSGGGAEAEDLGALLLILLWCVVTFVATILAAASCYRLVLRPRLYKKLLKQE